MATNAVTGAVPRGREAKYILSDAHSVKTVLKGIGKDKKEYSVDSVEYKFASLPEVLEAFSGNEDMYVKFASEFVTFYAQRGDRAALSQKLQGPTKAILRMAKDFIKSGFATDADSAVSTVLMVGVSKNVYTQEFADENKASLISKLAEKLGEDDGDDEDNETEATVEAAE